MKINHNTTNTTNSSSNGPKCPNCGRRMALITWVGDEPPECAVCSGQTVVTNDPIGESDIETDNTLNLDENIKATKADMKRLEEKLEKIIELLEDN